MQAVGPPNHLVNVLEAGLTVLCLRYKSLRPRCVDQFLIAERSVSLQSIEGYVPLWYPIRPARKLVSPGDIRGYFYSTTGQAVQEDIVAYGIDFYSWLGSEAVRKPVFSNRSRCMD